VEEIPVDLKQFIFTYIDTVDDLRALLMLRAQPEVDWSVEHASLKLYQPLGVASAVLAKLTARGFLTSQSSPKLSYRYGPASADLANMVDRVVELDRTRPVTLINLIYNRTKDSLQAFSDAFRLRKED
jgi:hypothetical protein